MLTGQGCQASPDHQPRLTALRAALQSLAGVLHPGMLVIVESTIAPGTMSGFVTELLESGSGLRVGVDFFLGHCPERVMPGMEKYAGRPAGAPRSDAITEPMLG